MDQIKTGRFIAQIRKERSITQRQLAEKLGISDKTVSKWETGKGLPEPSLMMPLCEELGVTANELLCGERICEEEYRKAAERNIVSLMEEKYKATNLLTVFIVIAVFLAIIAGLSLTLRIQTKNGWIGSASYRFDPSGFFLEAVYLAGSALLFWVIQTLLLNKSNSIFKYLPLMISIIGYLFCFVLYFSLFGSGSPSVIAENRYFAMFMLIPVSGGFIGCLLSIILYKLKK